MDYRAVYTEMMPDELAKAFSDETTLTEKQAEQFIRSPRGMKRAVNLLTLRAESRQAAQRHEAAYEELRAAVS